MNHIYVHTSSALSPSHRAHSLLPHTIAQLALFNVRRRNSVFKDDDGAIVFAQKLSGSAPTGKDTYKLSISKRGVCFGERERLAKLQTHQSCTQINKTSSHKYINISKETERYRFVPASPAGEIRGQNTVRRRKRGVDKRNARRRTSLDHRFDVQGIWKKRLALAQLIGQTSSVLHQYFRINK